jgi:DNA-binding response OmpR family regulator
MRLLLVEDNEELAQLLTQRLQAAGYETDVLTTAAEAQSA